MNNYTPIDVSKLKKPTDEQKAHIETKKSSFDLNVVFLSLIVITLLILAVLLFLLIQKKMQELSLVPLYFA